MIAAYIVDGGDKKTPVQLADFETRTAQLSKQLESQIV